MRSPLAGIRREFEDLNGDGVPDGAEVNMRRTDVDPATGSEVVTNAKWTKKAPQERFPMESLPAPSDSELPAAPAPVPADQQIPAGSPAPAGGSEWDKFKRRDARASDLMFGPGRRTNTDAIPEDRNAVRNYYARREADLSVAPEVRAAAGRRLAMMDTQSDRAMDLASGERVALFGAHGQRAKAQALVDSRVIPAEIRESGRATTAEIRESGRATTEAIKGQNIKEAEEIKTRRTLEVQRLKNSGNLEVANTYALAGRDKAELAAETDLAVAELNRQGKVESARLLAAAKGKIDPNVWMTANDEERKKLLEIAQRNTGEQVQTGTTTPAAKPLKAATTEPLKEEKDLAALKWARENPNDPRSAKIIERLGVK